MPVTKSLFKIKTVLLALLMIGGVSSASWATDYYVAKTGNNNNDGKSPSTALLTIQTALNKVAAGDNVYIGAGTYNESLVLKTTGTKSARITVKNYNGAAVTVTSGTNRAVSLGVANLIGYYTLDGLTFISTHVTNYPGYQNGMTDYSLDFSSYSWWGWGKPKDSTPYSEADPQNGGNGCNGFIIQNCNITGSIQFCGHYNVVQNCVMDGTNTFNNGIYMSTVVSHHNTIKNNKMTRYTNRAVWAMSNCSYITVANNDISHWGAVANPAAVDMDGANIPDYYCVIQHNTIHDGDGTNSMGMQFENGMNCVCDGNIIYNTKWGMTGINYYKGSGGSTGVYGYGYYNYESPNNPNNLVMVPSTANGGTGTTPYVTHNVYSNNVVYNNAKGGLNLGMTWEDRLYNNTFYNNGTAGNTSTAHIWLTNGQTSVGVTGIIITNNIFANGGAESIHLATGGSIASETNNLFYANGSNPKLGSAYLTVNPQFNNPSGGDFTLKSTSPAIKVGATVSSITTDIKGNPRPPYSIGAYETTVVTLSPPSNVTVW